ncbi:MAG: PIG-L family deacetylase [Chloracidobacterium sp.]|nr:PIG-L family deacetylase [Chloracidobacterium sp.]
MRLTPKRILRILNSYIVRAGPYRFLTKRYFGVGNIALTERIIEIESFRNDVIPQRLPVGSFKSILLLAPHQDDEVIGAGGTLVMARDAGVDIAIVYCTDGQQNDLESEVRRQESRKVCERLGAKMFELDISNLKPKPQKKDLEELNEIIQSVKPNVILCPWLFDGAPKHRMINHILWLANTLATLPDIEIWGYQVQNTLLPNGFVDITAVADEKRFLLECFPSQNGDRHYDHVAMGLAAWNSRLLSKSKTPAFVEIFFTLPARELMKLIEQFYFKDLELTYAGEPSVAANLRELHLLITKTDVGESTIANSQILNDEGMSEL